MATQATTAPDTRSRHAARLRLLFMREAGHVAAVQGKDMHDVYVRLLEERAARLAHAVTDVADGMAHDDADADLCTHCALRAAVRAFGRTGR